MMRAWTAAWLMAGAALPLEAGAAPRTGGFFFPVRDDPAAFLMRGTTRSADFTDDGVTLWYREGARSSAALRWSAVGARRAVPTASVPLPTQVNLYRGDVSQWRLSQPTFGQLRYEQLWPGIAWVLEGETTGLRYHLTLARGARASQIRLRYQGEALVAGVVDGKQLELKSGAVWLRESALRCFQPAQGALSETPVACRYQLHASETPKGTVEYGFELSAYDATRPVVVDPTVTWARVAGSNSFDEGVASDADDDGNVVITGVTQGTDLPPTGGPITGANSAFVMKFSSEGTVEWVTYLGGNSYNFGTAITARGSPSYPIYASWNCASVDCPLADGGTHAATGGMNHDVMLSGLSTLDGRVGMTVPYGGFGNELNRALVYVPSLQALFLAGDSWSQDFPMPGGAPKNNGDAYLMRVSPNGAVLMATRFGGTANDVVSAMATDGQLIYLAGFTDNGATFPVSSTAFDRVGHDLESFVSVHGLDGSLRWSSLLGGDAGEAITSIALDNNQGASAIFVTGMTNSSDFPGVKTGTGHSSSGESETFVTRIGVDGGNWNTLFFRGVNGFTQPPTLLSKARA